jgi:3-phosphoshikimate 1-carboxyvinyltransferase
MPAKGTVRLPGSKSISNRFLLLAALAEGETESATCLNPTTRAHARGPEGARHRLATGQGNDFILCMGAGGVFPVKQAELFLGNAGTAFSSADGGAGAGRRRLPLSGVPRMHERPIGDLVDALRQNRRRHPLPRQRRLPAPGDPSGGDPPSGGRVTCARRRASSQFLTAC